MVLIIAEPYYTIDKEIIQKNGSETIKITSIISLLMLF